jgi:hypothetical protein
MCVRVFAIECAIRGIQVNQDGVKINGALYLLVCVDDVIYWKEVYIL